MSIYSPITFLSSQPIPFLLPHRQNHKLEHFKQCNSLKRPAQCMNLMMPTNKAMKKQLFEIHDKIYELNRMETKQKTYESYRRNPYWASIPYYILRRYYDSTIYCNPDMINLKSEKDLQYLNHSSNAYLSAISKASLSSYNVHQYFGIDKNSNDGESFKAPDRRMITNVWIQRVRDMKRSKNSKSKGNKFVKLSFDEKFQHAHFSNAVIIYIHSEKTRFQEQNQHVHSRLLDLDTIHFLREVGLVINNNLLRHNFPCVVSPVAYVRHRSKEDYWAWKPNEDSILLYSIKSPFIPYKRRMKFKLQSPRPCLSLSSFIQAQLCIHCCEVDFADFIEYCPYGGAIIFRVKKCSTSFSLINEYLDTFFNLYVDPVIPPPVSFWKTMNGSHILNVIQNNMLSKVDILSTIQGDMCELYLSGARQMMTDWDLKRSQHVLFPLPNDGTVKKKICL